MDFNRVILRFKMCSLVMAAKFETGSLNDKATVSQSA
jgi:hypothetical protein